MKTLVALTLSILGTVVAAGGASSSVDPGTELIWGDGAAPRYVPARAPRPATRPREGLELRWGTGGRPVLVPLAP
jgi:hypothetical protein